MASRSLARQLCAWGPIVALTLISIVIVSASYSSIQLYGLPTTKYFKTPNLVLIYLLSFLILYVYFHAMQGPGSVPLQWSPVSSITFYKANYAIQMYHKDMYVYCVYHMCMSKIGDWIAHYHLCIKRWYSLLTWYHQCNFMNITNKYCLCIIMYVECTVLTNTSVVLVWQ